MKSFKFITESLFSFNVCFQRGRNNLVCLGYSVLNRVPSSGKVLNRESFLFVKYVTIVILSRNVAVVVCGISAVMKK